MRKRDEKGISPAVVVSLVIALVILAVSVLVFPSKEKVEVKAKATVLRISPSTFRLDPGKPTIFTATLATDGSPVSGKTITWSATKGTVNPSSGTTDINGELNVTYQSTVGADVPVTITASFAGVPNMGLAVGAPTG